MMAGNTFLWKAFSQSKAPYLLGGYGPVRTTRSYSGICCGNTNGDEIIAYCFLTHLFSLLQVLWEKLLGEEEK